MDSSRTIGELIEHLKLRHQSLRVEDPDIADDLLQAVAVMELLLEDMRKPVEVFIAAEDFLKHFFLDNDLPKDLSDWVLSETGSWQHGPDTDDALMRLAINTYMMGAHLIKAEARQLATRPRQAAIRPPRQITSVAALVYALKSLAREMAKTDKVNSQMISAAASLIEFRQEDMLDLIGVLYAAENLAALVSYELPDNLKNEVLNYPEVQEAFDQMISRVRTVKDSMATLKDEAAMMQKPPTQTAH